MKHKINCSDALETLSREYKINAGCMKNFFLSFLEKRASIERDFVYDE